MGEQKFYIIYKNTHITHIWNDEKETKKRVDIGKTDCSFCTVA